MRPQNNKNYNHENVANNILHREIRTLNRGAHCVVFSGSCLYVPRLSLSISLSVFLELFDRIAHFLLILSDECQVNTNVVCFTSEMGFDLFV